MDTPLLFSIIVPCYNHARFLPEAIHSIAAQGFTSCEIIIVNDGSSDDTAAVANSLTERFSGITIFTIHQNNQGLAAARNAGIATARGQWIVALDSDDTLGDGFLSAVATASGENPDYNAITGAYREFGARTCDWRLTRYSPETLHERCNILCCTAFQRTLWERVGGYDPSHPYGYEDWNFWLRCRVIGLNLLCLPVPMLHYRIHASGSMTEALKEDEAESRAFHVCMLPQIYARETIVAAHICLMKNMRAESLRRLRHKAKIFPDIPLPLFWIGLAAEGQSELRIARAYYEKALARPWDAPWQAEERLAALA